MSFEPASPINVIVCSQCQGKGCAACDQLGVYAVMDNQTVAFTLPDFIDLKSRQNLRRTLIIKRLVLLSLALFLCLMLLTLV